MKRTIIIFVISLLVIITSVVYFLNSGKEFSLEKGFMGIGLLLVVTFALYLGLRRIQSIRKAQPPEDERSKKIVLRASSTTFYLSLYSWLALMYFSDTTKLEMHSYIGLGILIMAIEFALSWVYHNFFSKSNE